mmetsp:Transcript_441/g.1241  ORF Transcript_441/g.1241 Transcript_441/m.1241 type:complete len:381 (+) Transcript_441:38-1180(+)
MSAVGSDEMAHPLAERKGNVISRRSTRIETKVRQSALMDRVAKSVKRELKTLGLELKAWQVPEQKAEAVRKQRDCVLHFTTAQQRQRERAAAKATASAAASVLAKRLQNQSPCRPAIKLTRVHALSNIALQKEGVLGVVHEQQQLPPGERSFMITVYVNLARRVDRRRSIEAQMGKEGVQAWRLEAATAADADPRIVTRTWDSSINCKYDTRTLPAKLVMSNGERGCAMSHAILWHACAANGDAAPPMLILEDDAVICPNFLARTRKLVESVERAVPAQERTCLLYLGGDVMAWRDEKEAIQLGYGLREAEYVYQTSSYIVWPAAARKLLTELPVDGPADVYLSRLLLERKLRAFMSRPRLVYQAAPYENGDIDHTNIFA